MHKEKVNFNISKITVVILVFEIILLLQAAIEVEAYRQRVAQCEKLIAELLQMLFDNETIDPYTNLHFTQFIFQIDIDYMMVNSTMSLCFCDHIKI